MKHFDDTNCEKLLQKERRLHKLVAVSGFLFALCLLPVTQYYLVTYQLNDKQKSELAAQVDSGSASASTVDPNQRQLASEPETNLALPILGSTSGVNCSEQRDADLSSLDSWLNSRKVALYRDYQNQVMPYKQAIAGLTGTSSQIDKERAAIDKLVSYAYQPYLDKLTKIESAVAVQRTALVNRVCN